MRLKNILYFTVDGIICRKVRFFWSTILIGLSMLGIGYFMMLSNNYKYIKNECNRVLKRGMPETGIMNVYEYDSYEARKLKEEAMTSGKIESIGTWLSGESGMVPSQDLILERARIGRSTIGKVSIDRTMLGVCNIEFVEKADVPEEKWKDPNWRGMYLGGDYQGIPVGTVYELEWEKGKNIKYEVIGIMKKGCAFISSSVLTEGPGNGINSIESWDDAILFPMQLYVSDGTCTNYVLFTPAQGVSMKDAKAYLRGKAEELGLSISFIDLEEEFFSGELIMQDRNRIERELCMMLCVICILINVCYLVTQMMGDKRSIGIWFACGMMPKDIIIINVSRHIIQIIIAFFLGFFVIQKYCYLTYGGPYVKARQWKYLCDKWLWQRAFPQMLGFGAVLVMIYMIILIYVLYGAIPAKFMKNTRG